MNDCGSCTCRAINQATTAATAILAAWTRPSRSRRETRNNVLVEAPSGQPVAAGEAVPHAVDEPHAGPEDLVGRRAVRRGGVRPGRRHSLGALELLPQVRQPLG